MVSTDQLQRRLREALGADSLLFRRFDLALRHQDEAMMNRAIESLGLYPPPLRQQVEEVLLGWVFETGAGEAAGPSTNSSVYDHLS
jgi:hypothetical protein